MLVRNALAWMMFNRTYPAFPRSYGKTSNWTSAPDFGALLIRPILAEQPLGPVRSSQCQPSTREFSLSRKRSARRQRVFLIEEKVRQTPESFLDREKARQTPESFLD